MAIRGPRLEFAVGAFLLLALASLLVLALASTNRQFGFGGERYPLVAKFTQLGQLRTNAPVKIGGVIVGQVQSIELDPKTFQSVVTLSIDGRYNELSADTSAGIFTSGLLGESYIGLSPGGDPESLKPGDVLMLGVAAGAPCVGAGRHVAIEADAIGRLQFHFVAGEARA